MAIKINERWMSFDDECAFCGTSPVDVLTKSQVVGEAYDGDAVRCPECGLPGGIMADEDGKAYVDWHDEPSCDCEWCKAHPIIKEGK